MTNPPTTPGKPPKRTTHTLDPQWDDARVEGWVSVLLKTGVTIAAILALIGGTLYLSANGLTVVNYGSFHGPNPEFHTIPGIFKGVLALDSRALIQLALLALIATPVARVGLSLFGFVKQKDGTYVIITTIVLLILLFGLSGK
jgi:uncharacterized membrane protein